MYSSPGDNTDRRRGRFSRCASSNLKRRSRNERMHRSSCMEDVNQRAVRIILEQNTTTPGRVSISSILKGHWYTVLRLEDHGDRFVRHVRVVKVLSNCGPDGVHSK